MTAPSSNRINPSIRHGVHTHTLFTFHTSVTGQVFIDQNDQFLYKSITGNTNMLVLYNYNSNYKHVHTTPTRTGYHILLVYQRSHKLLPSRDLHPKLPKLDNEASYTLIDFLDDKHVLFQLYTLCIHWMNVAEQTTHMFKNYFIVRICDTDHSFNLKLLDKLLPQTLLTFNLHRSIHLNPRISIYSQLYGKFDTNQEPLTLPGTNLFIHGTLDQRPT